MGDEKARTEQFPVRLTKRTKALLAKLAETDSRSMNDIVILSINEYARKHNVDVVKRSPKGRWV